MLAAIEPSAPQQLELVSRSATALTFRWSPPAEDGGVELLGYKVYVAEGDAAYVEVAGAASASDATIETHEHTAADLQAGVAYRFRVSAHNIIGEGPTAQLQTGQELPGDVVDYVLAADLPESPANPPSILNITETAISVSLATIPTASNGGSAVTSYLVEIDDGLGGPAGTGSPTTYIRVHDSLETTLIINGLHGGRTYRIRYAGRNLVYDAGNMFDIDSLKWSAPAEVLTAVVPQPPKNLRHGTSPDGTGTLVRYRDKILVQWDAMTTAELGSSPLAGFTIGVLDVTGTGLETETAIAPEAVAHTFASLLPGYFYQFRIKATNIVGTSAWSEYTAAVRPGVQPTRPGLISFTATTRTSIDYTFVELTGQDTGGTDAEPIPLVYHVYISKNGGVDYELLVSSTDNLNKVAEYLTPGLVHFFKYQAENDLGLRSEFSTAYPMMPGQTPSAPSSAPQLISQASDHIEVLVPEPADTGGPTIGRYEIEINTMSGNTVLATIYLAQSTDVTDMQTFLFDASKGLVAGQEYAIRARVHHFITDYFTLESPWGATATFYSSNLPEAIDATAFTYTGLIKTDTTINWALLSSDAAKGYSTTDPEYTLQVDLCGRETATATDNTTYITLL
jgi:hypothetical protein